MYLHFDYYSHLIKFSKTLREDGQNLEAARLLERLVTAYPADSNALKLYGDHLIEMKEYGKAKTILESIVALDPQFAGPHISLAKLLIACNQVSEATEYLLAGARAVDAYPSSCKNICEERRTLSALLDKLGQKVPALALIEGCISVEPEQVINHVLKADLLLRLKRHGEAEQAIQKALHLDITNLQALEITVKLYVEIGAPLKAIEWLERGAAKLPMDKFPDAAMLIADVFESMGEKEIAQQFLKNALYEGYDERMSKRVLANTPVKHDHKVTTTKDPMLLVFVADQVRARSMNIAQDLRTRGWKVVMLCNALPAFSWERYFDDLRQYESPEHALRIASEYNPRAFHVFSGNADVVSVNFVRNKPGKVIFDPYDFVEGFITQSYTYKVGQYQHFCLENADAICARDLRCKYLGRKLGYKLPRKVVLFSDYCSSRRKVSIPLSRGALDELHVVCCGNIATGKSQLEVDWGYAAIAQKLISHGVHFHLYPHPAQANLPDFESNFSDFIELARKTDRFHFHQPVAMDRVSEELSRYHFGINASFALTDLAFIPSYHEAHFKFCSSARNTEYLEAGLPVLINADRHRYQYWSFNRLGVAVDASRDFFEDPRTILTKFASNPALVSNIRRAQDMYSHDKHIERLIRFYESI